MDESKIHTSLSGTTQWPRVAQEPVSVLTTELHAMVRDRFPRSWTSDNAVASASVSRRSCAVEPRCNSAESMDAAATLDVSTFGAKRVSTSTPSAQPSPPHASEASEEALAAALLPKQRTTHVEVKVLASLIMATVAAASTQ